MVQPPIDFIVILWYNVPLRRICQGVVRLAGWLG